MNQLKKLVLAFFLFLTCSFLGAKAFAAAPATPVIEEITASSAGWSDPIISGAAENGVNVLIYLDDLFRGQAAIVSANDDYVSFRFQGSLNLSAGEHKVIAVAQDRRSLALSAPTAENKFVVPESESITVAQPALSQENGGVSVPEARTKYVPAPTLIAPNENTATAKVKPAITGLTVSGTRVHFYLDGVYNGKTGWLNHKSGTANFAYIPFLNLERGWHTIWAVTEDKAGGKSRIAAMSFRIEEPFPAPTLISVKTGEDGVTIVSGLAKNDSLIKVFVDHRLKAEFKISNHASGTAGFFRGLGRLSGGNHLVYGTATDERGKESSWSNIVYFSVSAPEPQVSSISEENQGTEPEAKTETPSASSEPAAEEQPAKAGSEEKPKTLEEILASSQSESEKPGEESAATKKSWINIIVFAVFLFGVAGWIFWVNRELAKERNAAKPENPEPEPNKNQNLFGDSLDYSPLTAEKDEGQKDEEKKEENQNNFPF